MDDDMRRTWWVIAIVVVIGLLGTNIATPTSTKIKAQNASITGITYTSP